ncbi:MAG: MoxR family ATPase [Sulfolobales archaeon]|nr:MoxR family ATPase [Sulfolobales archaeon]
MEFETARDVAGSVLKEVRKVYVGKQDIVKLATATLFSGGHLLIEGYPGTGKTLLAKTLAKVISGEFRRVQGHPDILPTDILGFYIYRLDGSKEFVRGPIFTNILMFDELNRAPTRTQAALLEAMQEYRATIDGVSHSLPRPFMVIATEVSPKIAVGAYQLMETLADRFFAKVPSYYNPPEEELEIVKKASTVLDPPVERVTNPQTVLEIVTSLEELVHLSEVVADYIVRLVTYLRNHRAVLYGPSHRASIHLALLSRAYALLDGRDYVIPDDVKSVAVPVVAHKIRVRDEYEVEGITPESLVEEALNKIPVPK